MGYPLVNPHHSFRATVEQVVPRVCIFGELYGWISSNTHSVFPSIKRPYYKNIEKFLNPNSNA